MQNEKRLITALVLIAATIVIVSTGTVRGATRSGGGAVHIDLTPLDTECKP